MKQVRVRTAEGRMTCAFAWERIVFFHCICFSCLHVCVCVWLQFSCDGTPDRRAIDSENLQINSWTAGSEKIRSEAQVAQSVVRAASEQTVISGL